MLPVPTGSGYGEIAFGAGILGIILVGGNRMNRALAFLILWTGVSAPAHADALLPPMTEETALRSADLVARVKVLSIKQMEDDQATPEPDSIISVEVLTKGVSAKAQVTVLWSQRLARATLTRTGPPQVGQTYRACLMKGTPKADFEPVHPDWAFVTPRTPEEESEPQFIVHTVRRGDTLYDLAKRYYGEGRRWRVLQVANFEKEAGNGVYDLKPGMKLRVPTFPMKTRKDRSDGRRQGEGEPDKPRR